YDQNGGKHGGLVGFLKTRLDANVNWMEDDREHDGYENGSEKRPDDQKTEIECNRGQDQQEEGSRYLLPFHWRTALPVRNSAYHGVHVFVGGRKHTSYQGRSTSWLGRIGGQKGMAKLYLMKNRHL